MSYTLRNLRDVKDAAAGRYGESQEARFARDELDASDTGLSFHLVRPGKRQAFGHRHGRAEEVYVVLAGSGRIKLDGEIVELAPLDAVRVSPEVARGFEAGPDGLEFIAFGPHHPKDGEILEDFWD